MKALKTVLYLLALIILLGIFRLMSTDADEGDGYPASDYSELQY